MSQSNVIFAAIFISYLIFITMRGELPVYAGFLLKSKPATASASNTTDATSSAPSKKSDNTSSDVGKVATVAAEYWWLA